MASVDAEPCQCSFDDPESDYRLIEIDENLGRKQLTAFDRAKSLWERKAVYDSKNNVAKHGGDRKSKAAKNQKTESVFCFSNEKKTHFGSTVIKRAVKIYNDIDPHVRKLISGTALADKKSELYNLAKIGASYQLEIVEMILDADAPVATVGAALKVIDPPKSDSAEILIQKELKKLHTLWLKTGEPARDEFLKDLGFLSKDYLRAAE